MSKPELSDPITLRLPIDVLAEIERIATASDRTRSWIMVRAMRLYLAGEGAEVLTAVKGRDDIRAGKSYLAEDLFAEVEEIIRNKVA
nr:ribbon-helix-helix protein, CopG family [uncultured Devosia sp.]